MDKLTQVLIFYIILTVILAVLGAKYMPEKNKGLIYGISTGLSISLILYFTVGKKYISGK